MAWRCSGESNEQLIDNLLKGKVITSKAVADALKKVDRGNFVLSKSTAYEDSPQSIGYGATISAPHMHAMCIELLLQHLKPGAKVLDVGSGSGYLVAVMAHLVKPNGKVYGVEHIGELVEWSRGNIKKDDEKLAEYCEIKQADGRWGLPDLGPFDCIHVGAAAEDGIPETLKQQLKVGGRLVIPVGPKNNQNLILVERKSEKEFVQSNVCGVMYVPLTSKERQLKI